MPCVVVVLAMGLSSAGCGDECELGSSRCVGGAIIERCEEGYDPYTPPHWNQSECYSDYFERDLCVVAPTGSAYCAAEPNPRPDLCPLSAQPSGEVEWTCDGSARIVGCIDGLVGWARSCGLGTCVISAEVEDAFCSILTGADPLCGDRVLSACADATTRVECREGYRVEQDSCTGAGGCRTAMRATAEVSYDVGLCALASAPEPACVEDDYGGQTGYCADGSAVNCYLGYQVSRELCLGECFDHGYWTECLGPSSPVEGWQYGDPPDCDDGFDNDYDGLVDFPDDPNCAAACCGSG